MNWKPDSDGWIPGDYRNPFDYNDKGVNVVVTEAKNTSNMYWTKDGSATYVVVRTKKDYTFDFGGVDLVSVNGYGEIRWVVMVDSTQDTDLEAMEYFGLQRKKRIAQ